MDFIGEKIRDSLHAKKMSANDLAKQIGLTKDTVENIIYGRSRKAQHMTLVARSLEINFDTAAVGKFNKPTLPTQSVDLDTLHNIFNLVTTALKERDVYVSKNAVNMLSNTLYDYSLANKDFEDEQLNIYLEGMIDFGILTNIFSKKK